MSKLSLQANLSSLVVFLLCFNLSTVSGQKSSQSNPYTLGAFVKHSVKDGVSMPLEVTSWKTKDWGKLAGISTLIGVSIFYLDDPVADYFKGNKSSDFSKPLQLAGDYKVLLSASALYYGGAQILGANLLHQERSALLLETILLNSALVMGSKFAFARKRPHSQANLASFSWDARESSFVSGHAASSFALAGSLSHIFKDKPWLKYVAYGAATGISFLRIHDNEHYLSDVLTGAALGYFTSRYVIKKHEKRKLNWMPVSTNTGVGICFQF